MKNLKFLWCSAHQPTQEQVNSLDGELIFLKEVAPELMAQLTNTPTGRGEMAVLAIAVDNTASKFGATIVQLGGSPAFLFVAGAKIKTDIIFADSERVSEDKLQPDGSVVKTSIFRHKGWI